MKSAHGRRETAENLPTTTDTGTGGTGTGTGTAGTPVIIDHHGRHCFRPIGVNGSATILCTRVRYRCPAKRSLAGAIRFTALWRAAFVSPGPPTPASRFRPTRERSQCEHRSLPASVHSRHSRPFQEPVARLSAGVPSRAASDAQRATCEAVNTTHPCDASLLVPSIVRVCLRARPPSGTAGHPRGALCPSGVGPGLLRAVVKNSDPIRTNEPACERAAWTPPRLHARHPRPQSRHGQPSRLRMVRPRLVRRLPKRGPDGGDGFHA